MPSSCIQQPRRSSQRVFISSKRRLICSRAAQLTFASNDSSQLLPPAITVRRASLADLDAICELEVEARGSSSWSRVAVEEELNRVRGLVLVAETTGDGAWASTVPVTSSSSRDQQLLGWLAAWHVPPDEVHLFMVAVRPACRRRRIAQRLLHVLLHDRTAAGARRFLLEVRVSNAAAQALYASAGFECVGLRRRYYDDGEDAVLMNLELDKDAAAALVAAANGGDGRAL